MRQAARWRFLLKKYRMVKARKPTRNGALSQQWPRRLVPAASMASPRYVPCVTRHMAAAITAAALRLFVVSVRVRVVR